jgi:hypothetical protein
MKLVARYTLDFYLVKSKIYEGDLTPTMYDPQTLKPSEPSYIIKCDDGKYRKFMTEHFLTLEEWREQQLDKIL